MKKNKNKNVKKYATGTGRTGIIRHNIKPVSETMAEHDKSIAKAKNEAANNEWVQGLQMASAIIGTATSTIGGAMGSGSGSGPKDDVVATNEMDIGGSYGSGDYGEQLYAAFGGKIPEMMPGMIPAEVEGGEVAKGPNGEVVQFKGPSHEKEGIDILAAPGTKISSVRVKDEKGTMASKALNRAKKEKTLESLSEKNGGDDILLKNSLKRTKTTNAAEEKQDDMLQEMAGAIAGMKGMANEFALGGEINYGDLLGMAGTFYSATEGMKNTREMRAGDAPSVNTFKDFGNDALDRVDEAKGYVEGQRDNALKNLNTGRNRALNRNRKSARGVNTMRALDLGVEAGVNKAQGDIYDNFSKQMVGLLSQQAGFENTQDQAVMGGEERKNLAEEQKRDAYYSALAKNINTKGEGIQTMGKMLNESKKNRASTEAVNSMSQYGFKWENGKLVDSKGTSVTEGQKNAMASLNGYDTWKEYKKAGFVKKQ